jgi:hypothetical protein
MPSNWGISPRQSVEAECGRRGRDEVVNGCIALLDGRPADDTLILALGGPAAEAVLAGREGGREGYWPRVWAARGLLYAWDDRAGDAIVRATTDESWRVREMALKVIARNRYGDAIDAIAELQDDPVARVRQAARRALVVLTSTRA